MKCYLCNYDHVDVHDTDYSYGTYCQQCGATTEIKRTHPRRMAEIRKLPMRQPSGQITSLDKQQKKRRHG